MRSRSSLPTGRIRWSASHGAFTANPPATPYFDFALLDTGAATHILTNAAANNNHFAVAKSVFRQHRTVFAARIFKRSSAASGQIDLRINDPLGVYAAGLADGSSSGTR